MFILFFIQLDEELRKEEISLSEQQIYEQNQAVQAPTETNHHQHYHQNPYDGMQQMSMEDYDDLMPDPMQFVSLMGAPPPPPMVPPPTHIDKNEPVLPPGN